MSKTRLAVLALLGVGFVWGAAFVLMKDAIVLQPYMDFLATRFTIAAIAMILLRPVVSLRFEAGDIRYGALIGVVLAFGYITQTIGLDMTTAATSGFLTGLYVVFTPLIAWLFTRQKVSGKVALGVLFSIVGMGIFSGAANSTEFQLGQIWLVVCAVLYAVHILLLGHYGKTRNSYRFAMLQIAFVAMVTWGFALVDGYQPPPNFEVWFAVLFTALLSTVLAFWIQTWAQTLLDPARVALLITSEVIFTALLAIGLGQEPLTLAIVVGGGMMLTAMLIVEWPRKGEKPLVQTQLHE
ncbi:MAG: DMT family transporter [Aquiluna sp.]|uniref:DMT family transporter n=1 Tax=Aquiluna sp. TaxID=2053504 RepID=UPI0027605FA5|nr:DMT family transporter [Aquiluna sp.]